MLARFWSSPSPAQPVQSAPEQSKEVSHAPDQLLILDDVTKDDEPFIESFDNQLSCMWTNKELNFLQDRSHIEQLSEQERKLFEYILAFFATADGEVLENAVLNYLADAETISIRMAYSMQVAFESIHIRTYAQALTCYVPDPKQRHKLNQAFKTDPLIRDRDLWMNKYIGDSGDIKPWQRLVAFVCAEGLFFMSAFLVIFWLRNEGLFPIFARANELIARDEWLHVKLGVARIRRNHGSQLGNTIPAEDVIKIIKEAVDLECEFASSLIPEGGLRGTLRLEDLVGHIKNLGNEIIRMIGIKGDAKDGNIWDVDASKLPPWVSWIALAPKASFYETTVTSYIAAAMTSDDPKRDEDF